MDLIRYNSNPIHILITGFGLLDRCYWIWIESNPLTGLDRSSEENYYSIFEKLKQTCQFSISA